MARRAHALATLLGQIDERWPDRPTASDGWIGDARHRARPSDHNPNGAGVVCAIDVTGPIGHEVVERIRQSHDARVTYVISQSRICSSYDHRDGPPWSWRPYSGSNAHERHAHVSVSQDPDLYDNSSPWAIDLPGTTIATAVSTTTGDGSPPAPGSTEDDVAELLAFVRRLKEGLESLDPPSNPGALALAALHLRAIRGDARPVTAADVRQVVADEIAADVDRIADLVLARMTERTVSLDGQPDDEHEPDEHGADEHGADEPDDAGDVDGADEPASALDGLERFVDEVAVRVRDLVQPDSGDSAP